MEIVGDRVLLGELTFGHIRRIEIAERERAFVISRICEVFVHPPTVDLDLLLLMLVAFAYPFTPGKFP